MGMLNMTGGVPAPQQSGPVAIPQVARPMGTRLTSPQGPQQVTGAPGFSGLAPYLRQGGPTTFTMPSPAQLGADRAAYQQRLADMVRQRQAAVDAYKAQQAAVATPAAPPVPPITIPDWSQTGGGY